MKTQGTPGLTRDVNWTRLRQRLVRRWRRAENPADEAFQAFANSRLDRAFYLKTNADVAAAGADPVRHWLEYGVFEGRQPFGGAIVWRGTAAKQARGRDWKHYVWRGEPVAICTPLSPTILRQIADQARYEPAVFAPGRDALPNLRRFDASDLLDRDGIDLPALFSAVPEKPRTVLIIPMLGVGGAEKYAADLVAALLAADGGPTLVVVTDQTPKKRAVGRNC